MFGSLFPALAARIRVKKKQFLNCTKSDFNRVKIQNSKKYFKAKQVNIEEM